MKNVKFHALVILCVASLVLAAVGFTAGSSNPSNPPNAPSSPAAAAASFWTQTSGPYGGVIAEFLKCPDGSLLARTEDGELFRSANHGAAWTHCDFPILEPGIRTMAAAPNGHIFVGTSIYGAFRSTDKGETWILVHGGSTYNDLFIQALAVNSKGWIFLFNDRGVYRSKDDGETWTRVRGIIAPRLFILGVIVNSKGRLFARTQDKGILRSADNGATWKAVNKGLAPDRIYALAVDADDHLYAGSNAIFRSVNDGASWTTVMSLPTDLTYMPRINSLAVTPAGDILAGTYRLGVYRSRDGGSSWAPANTGLRNLWVRGVGSDGGGYVYAGTDGGAGIYRSKESGIKWNESNKGLVASDVHALAANSSGHIFAGTSYGWYGGGMFRSIDRGAHWQTRHLADKEVKCIAVNGSGHIFAGTSSDGVFRSTNNGLSWMQVGMLARTNIKALAINASGQIFAGILLNGVFRSSDNGATWRPVNMGLTDMNTTALAVAPNGDLFAAAGKGVFRSTDNGGSWSYSGLKNKEILSLLAKAGGKVFAATNYYGVFYSADNGATWVNRGLKERDLHSLAVNSAGHVFVAEWDDGWDVGVYKTVNDGATWILLWTGMTNTRITSLVVSPDGYLYAGTNGAGVFRSTAPVD